MVKMELSSLRKYEGNMILFLLNGIADDNQDIAQDCVQFLEAHGKRMREALRALGDETDDGQQQKQEWVIDIYVFQTKETGLCVVAKSVNV